MSSDLRDPIGRMLWQDGQVLASRDLRAQAEDEARHRALHNRYLHATWGIAEGFGVVLAQDGAHVLVSPGYAIDSEGRDLLLAKEMRIPVPHDDGISILVASYAESSGGCRPTLPDADFCVGTDPRRVRAAFEWVTMDNIDFGPQVPLARALISQGAVQGDLDLWVRRYADRMVRPHIGQGLTKTGDSGWIDVSVPKRPDLWLQVDVDTSEAGFVNPPQYIATLCRAKAARKQPRPGSLDESAAVLGSEPAVTLDGIGGIIKPSATKFTYRVPRGSLPFGVNLSAVEAEAGGWVVAWIGIEQAAAGQTQIDLAQIVAALGVIL